MLTKIKSGGYTKRKLICLFILLLTSCVVCCAQINTDQLSTIIEKQFQQSPVKGLAVSVVDGEKVVLSKTLGKDPTGAFDENTPVCLGSVSKTLTALGVCRLVELGQLDFAASVQTYLPEQQQIENGEAVTIRDVLHHYSGISQEAGYTKEVEYEGNFSHIVPTARAGEQGIYSSANYALLGAVIETVAKKPYAQFMHDEVFKPLGLDQTFVPNPDEGRNMQGYSIAYGLPLPAQQMHYGKYIVPAGYIVTTLADMSRYAQFLLGKGSITANGTKQTYLSEHIFESMFTPYTNEEFGYGKSWGIGQIADVKTYSHEGMTKISNAQITLLPEKGLALSVVTNTNSGPFFSIASELSEHLVATIDQKEEDSILFWEYLVRILIGLLTLKMFYDMFISLKEWRQAGFPTKIRFQVSKIHQYFFDLVPLLVLIFLPKIIHTPISMLLRIMPDIGWAILLGGILALFQLALKLVQVK